MIFSPSISWAEIRAVQEGVAGDVRSDGRTIVQRRPFTISTNCAAGSASMDIENNGSCVEVRWGGTTVIAAATPSVMELTEGGGRSVATEARGPLFITIDAVPAAVDYYTRALQSHGGRYRHAFFSFLATSICQAFGADSVAVCEQLGVAEAEVIDDGSPTEAGGDMRQNAYDVGRGVDSKHSIDNNISVNTNNNDNYLCFEGCSMFPGEQLYIGNGYAFRTDVDVHVQEANGGNLPSVISLAVHAALKAMRLPCVTLHEASGGVSLEVDHSKPFRKPVDWSRLPVLCVLLISPTRHYVVDPTSLEELALPQQLHVAVNAAGQLCCVRYQQLPSCHGNKWLLGDEKLSFSTAMSPSDLFAVLHDVPPICQAMIYECDEALKKNE